MQRSIASSKASTRSIIMATVMLVGILLLAWGYLGGIMLLFYAGIGLVLLGVIPALALGVWGKQVDHLPSRKRAPN